MEACLKKCKFRNKAKCTLYKTRLVKNFFPDTYDDGRMERWTKCVDCMEKEISCDIDNKILEVYSFYSAFTQEMNILFDELDTLADRRRSIYK